MNIEFKEANYNDIPLIHQLAVEIWHEYYPTIISKDQINYMLQLMYSKEALKKQMDDNHCFTLILVNKTPAGYISVNQESAGNFFLNKFYIKKEYRNLKLGRRLLQHIELKYKDELKVMRLFVNRQNFKSINFYFENGFIIENVIDKPIGNNFYMNDFIMIKKYTNQIDN